MKNYMRVLKKKAYQDNLLLLPGIFLIINEIMLDNAIDYAKIPNFIILKDIYLKDKYFVR